MPLKRSIAVLLCAGVLALGFVVPSVALADTESDLTAASEKLETLGSQLSDLKIQLSEATSLSDELDAATDAKGEEVLAAQEELATRKSILSELTHYYYKTGTTSFIDFLFGATSFDDLVSRIYYADKVSTAHAEAIVSVEEASQTLAKEQAELETRQEEQDAKVAELMALVEEYQALAKEAAEIYNSLDAQLQAELEAERAENERIAAALDASEAANTHDEEMASNDAGPTSVPDSSTTADDSNNMSSAGLDSSSSANDGSGSTDSGNADASQDTGTNGITYSGSNGSLASTTRMRDTYLAIVTWTDDSDYIGALASKAASIGSDTSYFITVDDELCRTIVFQRSDSGWQAIKLWNMNGGKNGIGRLDWGLGAGVHKIVHKRICNWADEYFGGGNDWSSCYVEWYQSNSLGHLRWNAEKGAYEACIAIHSSGSTLTGWDNTGCCGLIKENAKWIYDYVPVGTTVYQFLYSDLL